MHCLRAARGCVCAAAARELVWHYQTVVLREFLPSLIGAEHTDLIMRGDRHYYRPRDQPFIPLEFADAAYRYGHSQIRHAYQLNLAGGAVPIFPDLLGFRPVAAEHRIEWPRLFETSHDNFLRDFGERFVPGYRAVSTVDLLMNAPLDE